MALSGFHSPPAGAARTFACCQQSFRVLLRTSKASEPCRLTSPSSGRPPAGFASLRPPLMSDVRQHSCTSHLSIARSTLPLVACTTSSVATFVMSGMRKARALRRPFVRQCAETSGEASTTRRCFGSCFRRFETRGQRSRARRYQGSIERRHSIGSLLEVPRRSGHTYASVTQATTVACESMKRASCSGSMRRSVLAASCHVVRAARIPSTACGLLNRTALPPLHAQTASVSPNLLQGLPK